MYDTHLTYRNSLHSSPSDPIPHISITLLTQEDINAAKSGQEFRGVNVHLYVRGPVPERLYDPLGLHKWSSELLANGIAELKGSNVFGWAVVKQASVHAMALTVSIRVRENHHDHKSCHRVMINDRVMRGPNVIRFDRYTYLGKVDRVA